MSQDGRAGWIAHWSKHRRTLLEQRLDLEREIAHPHFALLCALLERSGIMRRANGKLALLDADCGTGGFSVALTLLYPVRLDVHFFDISETALGVVRALVKGSFAEMGASFTYCCGDLLRVPFRSGSFDIVWNRGVMEHFSGGARFQTFREVSRVLKPGGAYLCIVPNRLSSIQHACLRYAKIQGRHDVGFQHDFIAGYTQAGAAG